MKLNTPKKIILGILVILIIWDLCIVVQKVLNYKHAIKAQETLNIADKKVLNNEYLDISKKYKIYENIFQSKEPVLIYSYTPGGLNKLQSEYFHEKLTTILKEKNIQHKIIAINNHDWENLKEDLDEKYIDNDATCTMVTKEQEQLEDFIDFANNCFSNACIIDTKNKTYTFISRNAEYITKVLLGEVEIYDIE